MNDVKQSLQTAYYALLNGNITYSSTAVPVYDVMNVPQSPDYPHILITDYTQVDDSDKSSFGEEITVDIEIIDRAEQRASRAGLFSIVNQIKNIIRVRPEAFDVSGWNIFNTNLDTEITIPKEFDGNYIYFGSRITFRHSIEEL
jgi:hypothetical protein